MGPPGYPVPPLPVASAYAGTTSPSSAATPSAATRPRPVGRPNLRMLLANGSPSSHRSKNSVVATTTAPTARPAWPRSLPSLAATVSNSAKVPPSPRMSGHQRTPVMKGSGVR